MMFGSNTSFEYLICDKCRSLSLINIPDDLASYYPKDYYSFVGTQSSNIKKWISNKKSATNLGQFSVIGALTSVLKGKNSNLAAIKICKPNRKSSKILDVGSGGGLLLDKLNEQGFRNIMGIDPYLEADVKGKEYEIKKMTMEELADRNRTFDIIILSHVFEHLEQPGQGLDSIHKLLDHQGHLILRVPISTSLAFSKFKNNWFQIDAPRHILIPSFSGLVDMCSSKGFELREYFFDSEANQFLVSEQYEKGISMRTQKETGFAKVYNPRRLYYSFLSIYANHKDLGDQATFIFKKK